MNDIILTRGGKDLNAAKKVMIMLHGRGGSSADMLAFSQKLEVESFTLLAPQAATRSWYPRSFMEIPAMNEPSLSDALDYLYALVIKLGNEGIGSERIYFLGFSQGACLTLEFVTRHPASYGGVIAFTGGLIGDKIYEDNYEGDFGGTPVFIGTSDPDMHVPVERVEATGRLMKGMNASVTTKIYVNMGHTINEDEIRQANGILRRIRAV